MKDNIKWFLQAGLKNNYDAIFGTEYDSSVMGNNNTSYFNTYDAVNSSNAGSTPNNILNQIWVSFWISF
jgi:hypothetical protein